MVGRRTEALRGARAALQDAEGILVLTGAGVSAESGVPTFRDARDGLWSRYRPEELATPDSFRRDPGLVWRWYAMRRRGIAACRPNAAHRALARLLLRRKDAILVTQNVDGLHHAALDEEEAPSQNARDARGRVLLLHGDIFRVRCTVCTYRRRDRSELQVDDGHALPRCPRCGGDLRPDVVWFGEPLPTSALEGATTAAAQAEICLVVGTSALVHPAASLPRLTLSQGGELVEVNPDPTPLSSAATWRIPLPAGEALPHLLGS